MRPMSNKHSANQVLGLPFYFLGPPSRRHFHFLSFFSILFISVIQTHFCTTSSKMILIYKISDRKEVCFPDALLWFAYFFSSALILCFITYTLAQYHFKSSLIQTACIFLKKKGMQLPTHLTKAIS